MKTAIAWLVSLIVNIVNPIGMLACCFMVADGLFEALIVPACIAPLGFIFGIFCWKENVAPRMFWVKSRTELFDSRVKSAFGYMFSFFNCACAVVALLMII